MTILYDATRPVKTTRRFGAGILATYPTYRVDYSAADAAWLAADNARREAENRMFDRMAREAAALDALTRGLIPA
jgi:hypothetical protein